MAVEIVDGTTSAGLDLLMQGRRPLMKANGDKQEMICNAQGHPVVEYRNGLAVHSLLRKDEWEELDRAVIEMVKLRLQAIQDLRARNLTRRLGGLGTMVSQWNVASEKPRPTVSMDGRTRGNRDRVEKALWGVPVPIIHDEYEIGARELEASRRLGDALDTTEARESAAAVAEEAERMLFNGDARITVGGNTIFGLTTLTARLTDTAANFGGGDFGIIGNIKDTYLGVLAALAAIRYHGPFGSYISNNQYHELLATYADGSGQTALQRVTELPQIEYIKPSDFLADGNMTMVQLTANVIDVAEALGFTNREWQSGDQMALHYKVMTAIVPRLKTDYAGNAGVAHVTGC